MWPFRKKNSSRASEIESIRESLKKIRYDIEKQALLIEKLTDETVLTLVPKDLPND